MKITRRGANRSVPITVSCTIIRIARGEASISIIVQIATTPASAHARRHSAQTELGGLYHISRLMPLAASATIIYITYLPFWHFRWIITYFVRGKILKKFPPQAAEINDLCWGCSVASVLHFWVKGACAPSWPLWGQFTLVTQKFQTGRQPQRSKNR